MTTFAPVTEARAAVRPHSERTSPRSLPRRVHAWLTAIGLAHAASILGPQSVYPSAAAESLRLAMEDYDLELARAKRVP